MLLITGETFDPGRYCVCQGKVVISHNSLTNSSLIELLMYALNTKWLIQCSRA